MSVNSRAAELVVVGPTCAGLALVMLFILLELAGQPLLQYDRPRNIAEAAGMATASEVLRFLRAGADPNAVMDVRPEVISSSITKVSAVEAAIWGREVALVRLLDRQGAIAGVDRRRYLACLSDALKAEDIARYLAPQGTHGCTSEETVTLIEARSR
jgi:hypothetical protein